MISGKGNKQRVVPVLPLVAEAPEDYVAAAPTLMIRYSWDLGATLPPEAGTGDDEALAPGVRPAGDGDAPCAAPQLRHPSPGRFAARTLGKRCRPSGYFEWPGPRPGRPPMPPNEDSRTGTLLSFLKVIIVPIA